MNLGKIPRIIECSPWEVRNKISEIRQNGHEVVKIRRSLDGQITIVAIKLFDNFKEDHFESF